MRQRLSRPREASIDLSLLSLEVNELSVESVRVAMLGDGEACRWLLITSSGLRTIAHRVARAIAPSWSTNLPECACALLQQHRHDEGMTGGLPGHSRAFVRQFCAAIPPRLARILPPGLGRTMGGVGETAGRKAKRCVVHPANKSDIRVTKE